MADLVFRCETDDGQTHAVKVPVGDEFVLTADEIARAQSLVGKHDTVETIASAFLFVRASRDVSFPDASFPVFCEQLDAELWNRPRRFRWLRTLFA